MLFKIAFSYFYSTHQLSFQLASSPSISFVLLLPQTPELKSKGQHTKHVQIHMHTAQVEKDRYGQYHHGRAEAPDLRTV